MGYSWREHQETPDDVKRFMMIDISQNYEQKHCINAIEVGIINALNKVFGKK